MLSLATVTLSPSSPAISSSAGAIIRHGPHHSAQKSTSTGPSAPNTSVAKFWSVTVLVAMAAVLLNRLEMSYGHSPPPSQAASSNSFGPAVYNRDTLTRRSGKMTRSASAYA